MMNIVFDIVISITVGAGSGYAAVRFIGKKWVDHLFAKSLKEHQAELDRATNELKEKLKVEYGDLLPKRTEAIQIISQSVIKLQDLLKRSDINRVASCHEELEYNSDYIDSVTKISKQLIAHITTFDILFSKKDSLLLNAIKESLVLYDEKHIYYENSITAENCFDPEFQSSAFWDDNKSILLNLESSGKLQELISRFRDLNKANIL